MDRRDRMAWFPPDTEGFDEKTMRWTFEIDIDDLGCKNYDDDVECSCTYCTDGTGTETFELPAKFEICGTCQGRGSHVNPSIDAHGISREEFDEDPDFRESYMSGMYDVSCYECHGGRVVPVVDTSNLTESQQKVVEIVEERARAQAFHDNISYLERMMGA